MCLVSLLTRKPTSRRAPDLLCSAHRCNLQIHRRRTSTLTTCSPSRVCLLPDLHFLPPLRRVLTADDSTHIQQQHAYLERLAMARKRGSPPAPFAQVDRASARRAPLRQAHRLYIARDGPSAASDKQAKAAWHWEIYGRLSNPGKGNGKVTVGSHAVRSHPVLIPPLEDQREKRATMSTMKGTTYMP